MSIIAYLPVLAGVIGGFIGGHIYKKNRHNKRR